MKNRIVTLFIALTMLFCCGCDANTLVSKPQNGKVNKKIQTVISMNPSVILSDGTVESARKVVSDSMAADVKSGELTLYDNTNWQWAYVNSENSYTQRTLRALESFKDGSGSSGKDAPYSYTVTDDRTSSIAVYDTSKMDIKGYGSDTVAPKGILFTFTGEEKEAFIYTADTDCTLSLGDTENGTISLIKQVGEIDTDTFASNTAKGIVMGIYVNNRLLWQEILGNDSLMGTAVTSVSFPTISNIEMKSGDSFVITAQIMTDKDGIETGSFEMPGGTSLVTVPIKVGREVEVLTNTGNSDKTENTADASERIYFLNDNGLSNFGVTCSKNATAAVSNIANNLRSKMAKTIGTNVIFREDNKEINTKYRILLGDTAFAESKVAINEIKNKREDNAADFIIRMVGNNLVIAALTEIGLQTAVDYFTTSYLKDEESFVPKNINYISSNFDVDRKPLTVNGNNLLKYQIVRSRTASYIEVMAINDLVEALVKVTGYSIPVVDDYTTPSQYEIVIGTTRRTVSDYNFKATSTADNSYKIEVKKNKLFIAGNQAYGTNAGILEFVKKAEKTGGNFADGYSFTGAYDGGYSLTNGYKLAWSDEFNGTELSEVWRYVSGTGKNPAGDGFLTFSPNNSYVENGALVQHITYDKESGSIFGGSVDTQSAKPFWYQYGYMEYRVKMPTQNGTEHAFWASARNDHVETFRLELDLTELGGNPWRHHQTIHKWQTATRVAQYDISEVFFKNPLTGEKVPVGYEYHTIGFEWDDDTITFTNDGEVISVFDVSGPSFEWIDNPVNIRIDTNIYGAKTPDRLFDYENFVEDFGYVDYVRLYQKANNGSKLSFTHLTD